MKFPKLTLPARLRQELTFERSKDSSKAPEMYNMQLVDGCLCQRPSLKFCCETEFDGGLERIFVANGKTVILGIGDSLKVLCFDRDGNIIDSGEVSSGAENAVMLIDDDKSKIYFYGNGEDLTAEFYNMGTEYSYLTEVGSDPSEEAYVPTVGVGGKGRFYNGNGTPKSYNYGGTLYESKNMMTNQFNVRQTSNYGNNVYALPFPIEEDTSIFSVYTDNAFNTYTHTLETNYNGKIVSGSNPYGEDGLRLKLVGDGRNAIVFEGKGDTSYSTANTPDGNNGFNRFFITVTYGYASQDPCGGSKCTLFRSDGNDRTWIVYGCEWYPSRVWLTGYSDTTYFPDCGQIDIGNGEEPISAIVQLGQQVAVLKEGSLWLGKIETGKRYTEEQLSADDVGSSCGQTVVFSPEKVADIGCDCPETAVNCNGRLIWLNSDGVVRMMTSVANPGEGDIRELSYAVSSKIKRFTPEQLKSASATFCNGRYYLLIENDLLVLDCLSSAMDNYTSYADDITAQKKLGWYLWNVAQDGIVWSVVKGDKKPILFGKRGNNIVCCSVDGNDGADSVGAEAAAPIEWNVTSETCDFSQIQTMKTAARFAADICCENEANVALVTENGCGGCTRILPSDDFCSVVAGCGESGRTLSTKIEGRGSVKIKNAAISCRLTGK